MVFLLWWWALLWLLWWTRSRLALWWLLFFSSLGYFYFRLFRLVWTRHFHVIRLFAAFTVCFINILLILLAFWLWRVVLWILELWHGCWEFHLLVLGDVVVVRSNSCFFWWHLSRSDLTDKDKKFISKKNGLSLSDLIDIHAWIELIYKYVLAKSFLYIKIERFIKWRIRDLLNGKFL